MTREKMTRNELIKEIAKRMKEIRELYYSVYPKGNYLSLFFKRDYISFNNNQNWRYEENEDYPIEYWECEDYIRINGIRRKK